MSFDEFAGEAQHRARLGTMGEAVRCIRCTLAVLSQRLAGGEVKDLASQLPEEIAYYLRHSEQGAGLRLSADEFLDRVSACEGADKPEGVIAHFVCGDFRGFIYVVGDVRDAGCQ